VNFLRGEKLLTKGIAGTPKPQPHRVELIIFIVKGVDEEVKKLVLMDFTVHLLIEVHILSKQTF
jgi:hypothetical protein